MKELKNRVAEFPVNRWLRSTAVNFHNWLMKNGLCPMGAWEKLRTMGEHGTGDAAGEPAHAVAAAEAAEPVGVAASEEVDAA